MATEEQKLTQATEEKVMGAVNGVPTELTVATKPNDNGGYDTTVKLPKMSMSGKVNK